MRKLFALVRRSLLCERTAPVVSARQTIGWWEARRVPFNLIVGCAGVVSIAVVSIVGLGAYFLFNSELGLPDPPLFAIFGVILYALVVNICYTGGWIVELVIRIAWPEQTDRFATLSLAPGPVADDTRYAASGRSRRRRRRVRSRRPYLGRDSALGTVLSDPCRIRRN